MTSNRVLADWLGCFANPLLISAGLTACYIMLKHSFSVVPVFEPRAANRLTRHPLQTLNDVMELVKGFTAMSRHESRSTPKIISSVLYTDDQFTGTRLDSPAWFAWLSQASTFYYDSPQGTFTAHCEARQRGGRYWIAYRRQAGILRRVHLGKPELLTSQRLEQTAVVLQASPLQP